MNLNGKTIAVTGALGRTGGHISKALTEAGANVVNIDRVASSNPFYFPSRIVDLSNYGDVVANLTGCDAVVHFGANPWPDMDFFAGADRFANNTVGTFNVFQAAAHLGIDRIVWASSETVQGFPYEGYSPPRIPILESDDPAPFCAYALSKLACERTAEDMSKLHGTTILGLRLAHVLYEDAGDYDQFVEYQSDLKAKRNTLWKYIDIRDVVSATLAGLTANISGAHVFNISAADTVLKISTREAFAQEFPKTVIEEALEETQAPVDLSRAETLLKWVPQVSWRDILGSKS